MGKEKNINRKVNTTPKDTEQKKKPIKKNQKQKKKQTKKMTPRQSSSEDYQIEDSQSKNKKQLKNTRKKSGVPLGRPFQNDRIKVQTDPTLGVQQCILSYLQKIGLRHGLVFRPEERLKMNAESVGFNKWGENHCWNQDRQIQKIQSSQQIMKSLAACRVINQDMDVDLMIKILISTSLLATEQCTMDLYHLFQETINSIQKNESENKQIERADKLYQKLIFLTAKFTKLKVKHWLQFIEQEKVRQEFRNMFKTFKKEVNKIIMNVESCKDYYAQQEWMTSELKKRRTK